MSATDTAPVLDGLLAHIDKRRRVAVRQALILLEDAGAGVDKEDGPILYEVEVPFLGHVASLGALCATVNDAIREEFDRHEVQMPGDMRTVITTGAMLAGNFDQALAYLMRWVSIESPED